MENIINFPLDNWEGDPIEGKRLSFFTRIGIFTGDVVTMNPTLIHLKDVVYFPDGYFDDYQELPLLFLLSQEIVGMSGSIDLADPDEDDDLDYE